MRIAFLWDWDIVPEQAMTWMDGLAKAVLILSRRHDVKVFAVGSEWRIRHKFFDINVIPQGGMMFQAISSFQPDVILHWGDMTRPHAKVLASMGKPMAICFAGGATDAQNWYSFGHVFVENEEYRAKFEEQGIDCSIAFGTNTELYTPMEAAKNIDVYFPATFADWKRHDLFSKSVEGLRAVCAGYMYPVSERYCWEDTMKRGVTVMPHISAEANRVLMAQSRCVLVTSKNVGGSQRTVLEALSMNIPTIVMSDNIKCSEYLIDVGCSDWIVNPDPHAVREKLEEILIGEDRDTRSKLMGKWDEETYAARIEDGLMSIL